MIKLTIVVCTYNRRELLLKCLESLRGQSLDKDLYEVVIVDNNSNDGTAEVAATFCRKYPNFLIVPEGKQGHSYARNRGYLEASGEFVAYIDDDCIADQEWAERVLDAFTAVEPTPTAVGGVISPRYDVNPPAWFADQLEIRSWGDERGFLKPPLGKYGFSGANMAFPRKVLERFGGFSPRFGIVDGVLKMGEDTELFLRLDAAGQGEFWFDPAIKVSHWTPPEFFSLPFRLRRSYQCGRSHFEFEKNPGRVFLFLRVIVSVPILLAKGICFVAQPVGQRRAYLLRALEHATHQVGLMVESGRALFSRWIL